MSGGYMSVNVRRGNCPGVIIRGVFVRGVSVRIRARTRWRRWLKLPKDWEGPLFHIFKGNTTYITNLLQNFTILTLGNFNHDAQNIEIKIKFGYYKNCFRKKWKPSTTAVKVSENLETTKFSFTQLTIIHHHHHSPISSRRLRLDRLGSFY